VQDSRIGRLLAQPEPLEVQPLGEAVKGGQKEALPRNSADLQEERYRLGTVSQLAPIHFQWSEADAFVEGHGIRLGVDDDPNAADVAPHPVGQQHDESQQVPAHAPSCAFASTANRARRSTGNG
jgi:hypothetical protein